MIASEIIVPDEYVDVDNSCESSYYNNQDLARGYKKKNPMLARRDNNKSYEKNKYKIQRNRLIAKLKCGLHVKLESLWKHDLIELVYDNPQFIRKSDGKSYKELVTQDNIEKMFDKERMEKLVLNTTIIQPILAQNLEEAMQLEEEINMDEQIQFAQDEADLEINNSVAPQIFEDEIVGGVDVNEFEDVEAPTIEELSGIKELIKNNDLRKLTTRQIAKLNKVKISRADVEASLRKAIWDPSKQGPKPKYYISLTGNRVEKKQGIGLSQSTINGYVRALKKIITFSNCDEDDIMPCLQTPIEKLQDSNKDPTPKELFEFIDSNHKNDRQMRALVPSLLTYVPLIELQMRDSNKAFYRDEVQNIMKETQSAQFEKARGGTQENISKIEIVAMKNYVAKQMPMTDLDAFLRISQEFPGRDDLGNIKLMYEPNSKQFQAKVKNSENAYNVPSGNLHLGKYKTFKGADDKLYGIKNYKFTSELTKYLKTFINESIKRKKYKKDVNTKEFLFDNDFGKAMNKTSPITDKLSKLLKKFGIAHDGRLHTEFRRAEISYNRLIKKISFPDLEDLADRMMHSLNMQSNVYLRDVKQLKKMNKDFLNDNLPGGTQGELYTEYKNYFTKRQQELDPKSTSVGVPPSTLEDEEEITTPMAKSKALTKSQIEKIKKSQPSIPIKPISIETPIQTKAKAKPKPKPKTKPNTKSSVKTRSKTKTI